MATDDTPPVVRLSEVQRRALTMAAKALPDWQAEVLVAAHRGNLLRAPSGRFWRTDTGQTVTAVAGKLHAAALIDLGRFNNDSPMIAIVPAEKGEQHIYLCTPGGRAVLAAKPGWANICTCNGIGPGGQASDADSRGGYSPDGQLYLGVSRELIQPAGKSLDDMAEEWVMWRANRDPVARPIQLPDRCEPIASAQPWDGTI